MNAWLGLAHTLHHKHTHTVNSLRVKRRYSLPLEGIRDCVGIVDINRRHCFTNKLIAAYIKDNTLRYSCIKVRRERKWPSFRLSFYRHPALISPLSVSLFLWIQSQGCHRAQSHLPDRCPEKWWSIKKKTVAFYTHLCLKLLVTSLLRTSRELFFFFF